MTEYTQEQINAMSRYDRIELRQEDSDDSTEIEHRRRMFLHLVALHTEQYRKNFTNPGAIQSMVYQEKVDQATDYIAGGYTGESDFPLLAMEAEVKSKTVKQVADSIIKQRSAWLSKITESERLRLIARTKIEKARKITSFAKTCREFRLTLEKMT